MDLMGHLAFLLIAVSFLVRDIFWLRLLSIVASAFGMTYYYLVPSEPLWLVINWNLAFVSVNLFQLGRIIYERREITLSAEHQELYETVFSLFSPTEFLKLMRLAQWQESEANEVLVEAGQTAEHIYLIYSGVAEVSKQGQTICELKDGAFIGEISFLSSGLTTASVKWLSPARYLRWEQTDLAALRQRNPHLHFTLQSVLGQDLTRKLQRQD